MTGYEQFLVVVLATFLAVFLLLGIICLVLLIKVLRTIRRVSSKAEHFADRAEAVGEFFTHASGPIALGRLLSTVVDHFFKAKDGRKRRRG